MKFIHILSYLLLAGLITACTKDELADGTQFAKGQYPLVINTANIGAATRAYTPSTPEGVWDDGMTIWVQVINKYDPTVANSSAIDWTTATKLQYSVAGDGTMTLADGYTAPDWTSSSEQKLIRAWYCRSTTSPFPVLEELPTQRNVETLQAFFENENYPYYRHSDFLFAQQEFSFGDDVSLTFYHQVAKVVVNINGRPLKAKNLTISSVYLKYATLFNASYSYLPPTKPGDGYYGEWKKPSGKTFLDDIAMKPATANTGVDFGSETGTQNADFTFEALVIPQTTSSDDPLNIRISVKSDDGYDDMWGYEFTSPVTWDAGHVYTYNLNLTPSGLQLSSISESIGWTENNTQSSGSVTTYTSHKAVGSGTAADPYQISNAVQLKSLAGANADDLDKCYKLTGDIDLSAYNWSPIGGRYDDFYGTFDGNGHTITGMTYNSSISVVNDFALFNRIGYRGTVKNLTIADANITQGSGGYECAGIAHSNEGIIDNCHVVNSRLSGTSSDAWVAGIAYENYGVISNSSVENCDLHSRKYIAGIACNNNIGGGTIVNCHVYGGTITSSHGSENVPGVVCQNYATIVACSNSATISGSSVVGLVEFNLVITEPTRLIACCNTGILSSSGRICGILLSQEFLGFGQATEITACYYSQPAGDDGTTFGTYTATWTDEIISTMNSAIKAYNEGRTDENRKCDVHWELGTDGYPVTVAGAPQ